MPISDDLKKLRQISYEKIKNFSAIIVNEPIGKLSKKDSARAIYGLSTSLIKAREQFDAVVKENEQLKKEITDLKNLVS